MSSSKRKLKKFFKDHTGLTGRKAEDLIEKLEKAMKEDRRGHKDIGESTVAESSDAVYKSCDEDLRFQILEDLKAAYSSDKLLNSFLELSGMSKRFLAEQVLDITQKTLYNYCNKPKDLPIRFREHILKLKALYEKGTELFGSSSDFNKWLKRESYGMGGMVPNTVLKTITGIDLIMEELIRIEFGATA